MNHSISINNQPKIFGVIGEGFKTLSSHLYLLLFPIGIDLYYLFGTRYTIKEFAAQIIDQLTSLSQLSQQSSETVTQAVDLLRTFFEHFSLTAALRTYPVGIPSLLASRPLAENPLGSLKTIEVTNIGQMFLLVLLFSLIGLILGTIYYLATSRTTHISSQKPTFKASLSVFLNLFLLSIIMLIGGFIISFPITLVFSLLSLLSPILGTIFYFVVAMIALTFIIPLYFSPHAIIVLGQNAIKAINTSFKTIRPFYSNASLFLTMELLIAYLTNLLWESPADNSAMLFVGIFGHALVTTALLIASFHYFLKVIQLYQESFVAVQTA